MTMQFVDDRIIGYENDCSWVQDVMSYASWDKEALEDFLGCFCMEPMTAVKSLKLPDWACEPRNNTYQLRRAAVMRERNWHEDMSLAGIIHLELIARDVYKRSLHQQWSSALERFALGNRKCKMLDYGSGVSSFTELALYYSHVGSTLADVDPGVVEYLRHKYARWNGRVDVVVLPSTAKVSTRARVKVDVQYISGNFDAIVAADVLEHVLDPLGTLLHLLDCLKPGGIILINYPKYIEGDWHTPEAFYLRKWCFALLMATCERVSDVVWRKRSTAICFAIGSVFRASRPVLCARSRALARRYFQINGSQLIETIRRKAHREVTVEELIRSVDN
jgi:2-polyprenyl-3-methyl-5-hydroxy-6-metoxy-1,4-benzoquinol methylase